MMPSNHHILCRPLLLLPSVFGSMRVFSNGPTLLIRWPKYWSFSLSIRPSSEYSGLISFRIDWFDLLAAQGTINTQGSSPTPQLESISSLVLSQSYVIVWLEHLYMTIKKTIALTVWTIVGKVMSLLFNTVSRFVKLPYNCTYLTG